MAGKGGGAWKVAYADFVTAMMAFFLVMWITAQDQKIKQAIARYFNNPFNFDSTGTSTKPDRAGSVFPLPSSGEVPMSDHIATGQGRRSYTEPGPRSRTTKAVSDWVLGDPQNLQRWRRIAADIRAGLAQSREVRQGKVSLDEATTLQLAKRMRDDFVRYHFPKVEGVYRDLLYLALSEVNWQELAQDLLLVSP